MEVTIKFVYFALIFTLVSCSNTTELETGEIRTFQILRQSFQKSNQPGLFVDARILLNREQIDGANTPVIFVELVTGQNGTLTLYPGQGIGQTWLGADGATITLEQGILKASRGMGDDMMGSFSSMPAWSQIIQNSTSYTRKISYITGNNKNVQRKLQCSIQKSNKKELIEIWDVNFAVIKFEEICDDDNSVIKNIYYIDDQEIVRRSYQYHSGTIGYITIERLDR